MGVRGLQSFLKNNPDLLSRIDLSDTNLVIDANNLMCMLFTLLSRQSDHNKNDVYGGDLVAFGEFVRLFFQNLKKCNITPILVFDGSVIGKQSTRDKILLKTNTVYKRGLDCFNRIKTLQESQECERGNSGVGGGGRNPVIPQITNHVFKCIANEMGIRRIQTPYEADAHIARLANELACPILTNDSDFLVFDIPNGYIMIDMFEFMTVRQRSNQQSQQARKSDADTKARGSPHDESSKRHKDSGNYSIQCYILTQRKFLRYFPGMLPATVPMLSILLGNDFVEAFTFDKLCDRVAVEPYRGALVANTFAHRKIVRILQWLCGKTPTEAINELVNATSKSDKLNIRNVLTILLRNYKIEDCDNFIAELDEVYPPISDEPNSTVAETPAQYLKRLMEQNTLSPVALDMSFHNPYYNYAKIDDFIMPSSNVVTYRPMSVCLTLLRFQNQPSIATTNAKSPNQKKQDTFEIWDRINGAYVKKTIYPCPKLQRFGSLEHINIYALIGMDHTLRKLLLLETFHSSQDELNLLMDSFCHIISPELSRQAGLTMMLVRYISVETCLKAKPQFVEAIFLTIIYYGIVFKDEKLKKTIEEEPLKKLFSVLSPLSVITKISQTPMEQIYRRISHFISQLQSAMVSYEGLNTLLDSPLNVLNLGQYMNCVLVFNLTKCLRLEKLKVESILAGPDYSCLLDCCNLIKTLVDVEQ